MPFIRINIPKFDTTGLRKNLQTGLKRRGRRNENLLLRTTQYFDTVRPVFQSELEFVGDEWTVTTAPLDDESGQIWVYLDQGTSVRYAWMNEGYVSGTQPRTFVTQPSSGHKISVTPQVPADPDGIEAREWTSLLAETEVDRYGKEMQDTISSWLGKFGRGASRIISGE